MLQVGVIGVPNAGKSTLTNYLIGSKVKHPSISFKIGSNDTLSVLVVLLGCQGPLPLSRWTPQWSAAMSNPEFFA